MKKLLFLLLIYSPALTFAQPNLESIQEQWTNHLASGDSISAFYWEDRSLIFSKVTSIKTPEIQQLIDSEVISKILGYRHQQTYEHDPNRYITVGILETDVDSLLLLTGWRMVDDNWKKEIDVILPIQSETIKVSSDLQQLLDQEREKWVELANQHNPPKHIEYSYTSNATYHGNGQQSQGRDEIADRYFYMENPNYQVDLEKVQLWQFSEKSVLEIGRYFTGAERVGNGGLYVILWVEQENGNWQIELDFNF